MPKHVRTENPPRYRRYQTYKRWLRVEFKYTCVFCNLWEREVGGSDKFAVEHFKPRKDYPLLATVYRNLLYSCPRCNSKKGEYWPTPQQRANGLVVLNPCIYNVDEDHIDKSSPRWQGISRAGRWNVWRFRLRNKAKIEIRRDRITSERLLKEANDQLDEAGDILKQARKKRNNIVTLQITRTIERLIEERDMHKRRLTAKRDPD